MKYYVADFETTTDAKDCRVWAWAVTSTEKPEDVIVGNTLLGYFELEKTRTATVYFHNLKFDGSFILDALFRAGYKHVIPFRTMYGKSEPLKSGEFSTVISDMGLWYKLEVCWKDSGNITIFIDSAKLIPLSVERIPKAYGLPYKKLKIDYKAYREYGHKLTKEEIDYVKADVIIVAKAIKIMHDNNQRKLTAASNALADYKRRLGKKKFERLFPKLDKFVDSDIRKSYKGGWTYVNPLYKNKKLGRGVVYDVNSMYPWAMKFCKLPYGYPVFKKGKPEAHPLYDLFVVQFVATFELKPGKFPSIQLKHTYQFADNEYIKCAEEPVLLTLTSVDYQLFLDNYNADIIEYKGTYYFQSKTGMFSEYIDYWYSVKENSARQGNDAMKEIAKRMLNSLYGKFGMKLEGRSKIPYFDKEQDKVKYKPSEPEDREGVYLPVATFITSYCRDKIIRAAQSVACRFVYADTDSIHILGQFTPSTIDIDNYRLGAFKEESKFCRALFIRQKTYMEVNNGKLEIKCAGMPAAMKRTVREVDFYNGAEFPIGEGSRFAPKLSPKVVPGGVILFEMPFKIH